MVILMGLVYVLWAGYRHLPGVMLLFGSPLPSRFLKTDRKLTDERVRDVVEEYEAQLTQLGFERLGTRAERLPLWWGEFYQLVYGSHTQQAFASIITDVFPPVLSYTTPFEGGEVVITTNSPIKEVQDDRFVVASEKTYEPEVLLGTHRTNVEQFVASGLTPVNTFDRQSSLAANASFYSNPYGQRDARAAGMKHTLLFAGKTLFFVIVTVWILML
jgi:hypothetical protein